MKKSSLSWIPSIAANGPHLVTLADWSRDGILAILEGASQIKRNPEAFRTALAGRSAVLLFEKPSLRTRVSFEIGIAKLGGHAMYLDHNSTRIGERETVEDYARNLSQWAEIIIARTNSHKTIRDLAAASSATVINALSDRFHPCQILADLLTLTEVCGPLKGLKIAFIGDGNNVCHSLMIGCAKLGMEMTIVTPSGYGPDGEISRYAQAIGEEYGGTIRVSHEIEAVKGHHAVYADTWISMGSKRTREEVAQAFDAYRVTSELMELAGPEAVFMHCLPATRGEEVTADVIDGPRSVVLQQAQNRMHAQNALLVGLVGNAANITIPGGAPVVTTRPVVSSVA